MQSNLIHFSETVSYNRSPLTTAGCEHSHTKVGFHCRYCTKEEQPLDWTSWARPYENLLQRCCYQLCFLVKHMGVLLWFQSQPTPQRPLTTSSGPHLHPQFLHTSRDDDPTTFLYGITTPLLPNLRANNGCCWDLCFSTSMAHRLKGVGGKQFHPRAFPFLRKTRVKQQPQQAEGDISDVLPGCRRSHIRECLACEVSWQCSAWQTARTLSCGLLRARGPGVTHLWLQLDRASQQPRDAHVIDTADPHIRWFTS